MTALSNSRSNGFYRALGAIAITGPMLLVFAAGILPDGQGRGELMVYGHAALLAVLAAATVLRATYARGFRKAFQLATAAPGYSVAA